MPGVIWIHPGRILVQSHQEDVLLLVGGVEREHAHHDEVRKGGRVKKHISTHRRERGNPFPCRPAHQNSGGAEERSAELSGSVC